MIAAFAEAMMRQAGLRDNAKSVASHVISILLHSFADGKISSRTNHREFLSRLFYLSVLLQRKNIHKAYYNIFSSTYSA